jgi:hypothetical protein
LSLYEHVGRWDDWAKAQLKARQQARLEALRKVLPGVIAGCQQQNRPIKKWLDEFLGEDQHDPVNRFFRLGIAP